ncbi:phage regulatory CII family protein [Maricaulis sp.]|uniref:phage regulatory CII family protein n=1 Tax=Maricaulis sp. TaxID=1486257 RepID=UPI003A8D0D05
MRAPAVYTALKMATADLIDENGLAERAARRTRGGRELLRLTTLVDQGDVWIAADQIVDLEPRASFPHVTAALAEAAGYVLVPLPDRMAGSGMEAESMQQAAEAIAAIAQAMADGKIDRGEAPHVRREIRQAIRALFAHDQALADAFPDLQPAREGRD